MIEKWYSFHPFKYVSLFSGVGGFEQALNKLGGTCVMASEIDKYANQAYEALYGHPTIGDVTKVAAKDVPDHDVLVGGFPCQAFSVAGKRLGFEDTRGTLFFEMARIAKEKQPKVILAENVKGLVSHDSGRTLDIIVQTLSDIGYRVDFEILNSKYFGVPQNRERIFIVAIREDLVENQPWTNVNGSTIIPKGKRRISQIEGIKTFNFDYPAQEAVTTRLRDILETNVDEKYYLSEEKTAKLVAQLEVKTATLAEAEPKLDVVGSLELSKNERTNRVHSVDGLCPTPSGIGQGGGTEPKIAEPTPFIVHNIYGGFGETKPRIFKDVSPTIRTSAGGGHLPSLLEKEPTVFDVSQIGHEGSARTYQGVAPTITAREYKEPRMVGQLEEVRPCLTPDRVEKRQNGRRFKDDGEEAFTLTAQDKHGVALGAPPKYRIRKLTPLECFRLQGFSDEVHSKLVEAGISNSQRYKMAGNAVTVNVIEAIGERLLPYLA